MSPFQQVAVRWADLDPNGHVRHSIYYDYCAQTRIALLERSGFGLAWMARQMIGPVIFREQAHFRRELRMGDEVTVDVQLAGLSEDGRKWRFVHQVLRGEECCAIIDLDGAWIDLRQRRLAVPPAALRSAFEQLPRSGDFALISTTAQND